MLYKVVSPFFVSNKKNDLSHLLINGLKIDDSGNMARHFDEHFTSISTIRNTV